MNSTILHTIGLAGELNPADCQRLANCATFAAWPEQEILFREGEMHANVYWIKQGRVRLEMSATRASAKAMLTLGPGDLLAWSSLLSDKRMTATATTVEPTTLFAFDADQLHQLGEQNPQIGCRVMHIVAKALSQRLVVTRLQLLDLFGQPISTRL